MRSLPVVGVAALLLAACAPAAKPTCETRSDGVRFFVDPDATAYGDIVEALRRDPDRMVTAAPAGGQYSSPTSAGPLICKTDRKFPRRVSITYPSRDKRHVGAIVDLYLGEGGRVEVAEFYIMLLAP